MVSDEEKKIQEELKKGTKVDISLVFNIIGCFYNILEPEHTSMPLQQIELLFPKIFGTKPLYETV